MLLGKMGQLKPASKCHASFLLTNGYINFYYLDVFTELAQLAMSVSRLSVCVCHRGKPASWWIGDFWSRRVSLLLANL